MEKLRSTYFQPFELFPPTLRFVASPLAIPGLPLVVVFFILRDALYSISNPVRNQLAMEMTVARERGTTAGLTHMTFDLGGAFGAGLAGALIGISAAEASVGVDVARFVPAFTVASVLVVVAAGLYYLFFKDWDERRTRVEESTQQPALRPVEGD